MTARTAAVPPAKEAANAPPVTVVDLGMLHTRAQHDALVTALQSGSTYDEYRRSGGSGSVITESAWDLLVQTSRNSESPSKPSNKRWRQPANVREFAAQANAVATMVLNGEMDVDAARQYSSVARTIAQAMSIEVTRARFLKAMPDLEFGVDVFDEEER